MSGCKVEQLLILWRKIGGKIGEERIFERKILLVCLERQKGKVCKTRYSIYFDESNEMYNIMRKDRLYSVIISNGWGTRIGVVWRESWKGIPNHTSNMLEW